MNESYLKKQTKQIELSERIYLLSPHKICFIKKAGMCQKIIENIDQHNQFFAVN